MTACRISFVCARTPPHPPKVRRHNGGTLWAQIARAQAQIPKGRRTGWADARTDDGLDRQS